jgi:HPt (histidine-containing phosphotransfer) domain-containing protein
LTELVRDGKPPETAEAARSGKKTAKNLSELQKYFLIDAEGMINLLENIDAKTDRLNDADIESYTVAVHGMKSALRNIGETKLSEFAFKLEKAGKARDLDAVADGTPVFIGELKALIAKLKPKEISGAAPVSRDDMFYLKEKLYDFKAACETYKIRDAETVLHDLKQKTWRPEIDAAVNDISVSLLRGEFKKAGAAADKIVKLIEID